MTYQKRDYNSNNSDKFMTQPIAEVGMNDVVRLLRSAAFCDSLRQAAAFTKNTGYESAFEVARDLYHGHYYVSRALVGTTENFKTQNRTYAGELVDFDFGGRDVSFDRCYRFLSLHFHPDVTNCPIPSYPDLLTSQTSLEDWELHEQLDVRPIIAVAHVLDDDNIVALIYQKSIRNDIGQTLDFLELKKHLHEMDFFEPLEVVDYLEATNLFHADVLNLDKRRAYHPEDSNYSKLKRFVHTPRR